MKLIKNKVQNIDESNVGFTNQQIDVIKKLIAPGLSDAELTVFLHNCHRTGLDPISKQIYAIKRGGRMTIQTGIDGLRCVAERTGKYSPGSSTEFVIENGKINSAKVFVKKMTIDGTWHEISAVALMCEYGGNTEPWKKYPSVMLEKCAEARALRRSFPDALSKIYIDDEMDQAECSDENKVEDQAECSGENKLPHSVPEIISDFMLKELMDKIASVSGLELQILSTLQKQYGVVSFREIPSNLYERLNKYIDKIVSEYRMSTENQNTENQYEINIEPENRQENNRQVTA